MTQKGWRNGFHEAVDCVIWLQSAMAVLSRYQKVIVPIPVLNSREFPNCCVPFRRRLQSVNVDGESRAFCAGRDEQIAKSREDRDEALEASWRSETLHRPFAFSQRQIRILGSIVQPLVRPVLYLRHHLSPGCSIRAHNLSVIMRLWRGTLFLQQADQQSLGSLGIAAVLDDLVKDVSSHRCWEQDVALWLGHHSKVVLKSRLSVAESFRSALYIFAGFLPAPEQAPCACNPTLWRRVAVSNRRTSQIIARSVFGAFGCLEA